MSEPERLDADGYLLLDEPLDAGSCLCYYGEDRCRRRQCWNRKPGEPIEDRCFDPGMGRCL